MMRGLRGGSRAHRPSDVDEIVGDHAEADPAPHSVVALVSTAIEAVSPLDHADTSSASGAPLLAVSKPAFLLLPFALGTPARAVGNAHALARLLCFARSPSEGCYSALWGPLEWLGPGL
jgi:hypothetical protein